MDSKIDISSKKSSLRNLFILFFIITALAVIGSVPYTSISVFIERPL